MLAFKIFVFFTLLNKESPERSISESQESFLSRISFQCFESCSRVLFFHLNNWDNEGDS